MIQINKQLDRPDKGLIPSGSLIKYNARFLEDNLTVIYDLTHWLDLEAKDGDYLPIPAITEFSYRLSRVCTEEEWAKLDDAGAVTMVEGWLKDIIDGKIGDGFTEII